MARKRRLTLRQIGELAKVAKHASEFLKAQRGFIAPRIGDQLEAALEPFGK